MGPTVEAWCLLTHADASLSPSRRVVRPRQADLELAKPSDNIPAVLAAYPGNIFSTLLAAVTAADLAGALDSAGPFTVFAPTDEAFTKYLAAAKLTPAEALASPALKEILEHHVVAG